MCIPSDEICNGKDDDCDGLIDEDGVCDEPGVPEVDGEREVPEGLLVLEAAGGSGGRWFVESSDTDRAGKGGSNGWSNGQNTGRVDSKLG